MPKLVRDLMKIGVPTCEMDTRLAEVAKIMARDNVDAVIVMDEYGASGVVSQTDLVKAFPRNWELLTAKEVMTERIVGITPDTAAVAAAHLMMDEKVHQIFIMHEHPGPSRPSASITMRAIVREMAGLPPERPEMPVSKTQKK
ncbi:MAG: CBS domain-containing protein [Anaerolineales bacterium]|nr:CBS domain-containing protein [Anaerolineales bacterium]